MQAESFLTEAAGTVEGDAKLKQVKVVVFTETCILAGHTYCMKHQRLLDVLNQDFTSNSLPIGKVFMPLTEVEVSFPSRKKEIMASIYVRKASILFVGEKSEHQPEMPETEDRAKNYPGKAKSPIEAEIHMPLYTLRGHMHAPAGQKMLAAVERADKFISVTNVQIHSALDNTALAFDFVAVNRDKIIYVGEY
ncbi:MAG: hypothetical protein WCA51_02110 [Dehalococcoidia bacterium]